MELEFLCRLQQVSVYKQTFGHLSVARNYRITPIRRWRDNSCINMKLFWYCHKHFSMPKIPGNN